MSNQTRREFLKTIVGGVGLAPLLSYWWAKAHPTCCAGMQQVAAASRGEVLDRIKPDFGRRPNILFFFTDDQRFDTVHALGNEHIITPNMDSLVRNGTAFTNAYIMGSMSGAVCVPSRAMLMTGRTLFRLEGVGNVIPESHITLPEVLNQAGYATFHTGKWHQQPKALTRCFSAGAKIFFGGMSDQYKVPVRDFDPTGKYPKEKIYYDEGKHSSELFSDAAIQFLRDYKDDKPFFVYIAYTAPHDPRHMPKKYLDMYNPQEIVPPENFLPEHPFDNGDMKTRDEKLAPWPRTPEEIRKHIAAYYAMITHVDAQIGRVLAALKETGQAGNTIIIFSGDNGLAVGRHGLMGKQNIYEHSVHVPLVICGPGIPKGKKRDAFCYLLDIYPTICDLIGVSIPSSVEGRSLATVIRGQKRGSRKTLFFAYKDVQRGIRDERYKLIEYLVDGKRTTQLFDLRSDRWELNNLAANKKYARHLHRLRKELLNWREQLGDRSEFWKGYNASL